MPRVKRVAPGAEWNELSTTAADWKAADPALLAAMLGQLHIVRAFEETVLDLAGAGLVHGPAHSSIGQEGGAVGSIVGLRSTDAVNGSHRGHHQFLAKALTHVTKGALDLRHLVTPEMQEVVLRTLAEICGLDRGWGARPGRVDVPRREGSRGDGHQRHRRRRRPNSGLLRLVAPGRPGPTRSR